MNHYNFHSSIVILLLLFSCTNKTVTEWTGTEKELPESILSEAIPISYEKVSGLDSESFPFAKSFYAYNDSIIIIRNFSSTTSTYVDIYNLSTKKIDYQLFRKGNGPGEALDIITHLDGKYLFVDDFIKRNLFRINLDSLLTFPDYKIPSPANYMINASPSASMDKNGNLILERTFCSNKYKYNFALHYPRLLRTQPGETQNLMSSPDLPMFIYNVSQGHIFINHERNRIVYASLFGTPNIEVYDYDLHPISRFSGPYKETMDYNYDEDGPYFKGGITYGYLNGRGMKDGIYLLYAGIKTKGDKLSQAKESYIFKTDWDGNILSAYRLDRMGSRLSVTGTGKMYVTLDDSGTKALYKVVIPQS